MPRNLSTLISAACSLNFELKPLDAHAGGAVLTDGTGSVDVLGTPVRGRAGTKSWTRWH